MAAYSVTLNPLHIIDVGIFESVIKAISISSVRVFDFQYIVNSNRAMDDIIATLSGCLLRDSPMFVCLLDTRLHSSTYLESIVADQVIQVLF